ADGAMIDGNSSSSSNVSNESSSSEVEIGETESIQILAQQQKYYDYIAQWESGTGYKIKEITFYSMQNGAYPCLLTYYYTNDFGNRAEKSDFYIFYESGGYKVSTEMGGIEYAIYFSAASYDISNGNYLYISLD
ncbi:MAG TPA: hypothetical protein IAC43_01130, partial [Candidatus Faecivivens stercoripullorum]|nr:hypothetical protein [Candidatus Faecivivens stercoripullorum]